MGGLATGPPSPPTLGGAPAKPWRPSITRTDPDPELQGETGLDALDGFHGLVALAEGRQAQVAFAGGAEAGAGGADHVGFVEQA